jgi:DNA-binding transcriptional ArsR family regulator
MSRTFQSMRPMAGRVLRPTLWRTCRVLANRTRLKMFGLLVDHPRLTVSQVASRSGISEPLASQYLRALNARSLLVPKRRGLWVHYRPATSEETGEPIATPLRMKFGRGQKPIDLIFRLSTAFTHPRRVEILRALKQRPRTLAELRQVTGVPRPSLLRHLHKLITRGFVRYQRQRRRVYISLRHPDAFGRALAALC